MTCSCCLCRVQEQQDDDSDNGSGDSKHKQDTAANSDDEPVVKRVNKKKGKRVIM